MGELLASRRAGRKLSVVVGLLLVPFIALWFIYFNEAKVNIAAIERELAGLRLSRVLAPLYYGDIKSADQTRRALIAAQESILGFAPGARFDDAFPALQDRPLAELRSVDVALQSNFLACKAQLDRAVASSGMNLESDSESYHLIRAAFNDLPELAQDHQATLAYMAEKLSDGKLHEDEFRDIMRSLGKLEKMRDAFVRQITAAMGIASGAQGLNGMYLLISKIKKNVAELETLIANARSTSGQFAMMTYLFQARADRKLMTNAAHLTTLASAHVETRIQQRQDALWQKFYLMTAIGVSFAAAGLGLSMFMFRRTLTQLDNVQQAKRESDEMANQMATMNADMSELNTDLAAKMRDLRDAQSEILNKGRMEQLGQLTATVAHELRNPLGTVRTSAFLLQRKLKGLNIDAEKQFERINNGITRCDNTITQLLDFSRTRKLACKLGNLDEWLARCTEEAAQHIPADVQVECILGLGDLELAFDGARLERAIVNLIGNASEAMVGVGKDIKTDATINPKISVQTSVANGMVAISVIDNGPGIAPENLEKIREPLFTTKNFGTGLGVPAVEQIAAQHDGKLTIESEIGKGANFTIWLPMGKVDPEVTRLAAA